MPVLYQKRKRGKREQDMYEQQRKEGSGDDQMWPKTTKTQQ